MRAMGNKIECAYRLNERKCAILTKKSCSQCPFHMTKEEVAEKRRKAKERIANLPIDVKIRIQEKYGNTEIKEDKPNDTV